MRQVPPGVYNLAWRTMLPILPALILLLLQGPSNVERLAQAGRLPEALEAIHRQMITEAPSADVAMASLLTLGSDRDLAQALALILSADDLPMPAAPALDLEDDPRPAAAPEPERRPLPDAFQTSRRTRDGPR